MKKGIIAETIIKLLLVLLLLGVLVYILFSTIYPASKQATSLIAQCTSSTLTGKDYIQDIERSIITNGVYREDSYIDVHNIVERDMQAEACFKEGRLARVDYDSYRAKVDPLIQTTLLSYAELNPLDDTVKKFIAYRYPDNKAFTTSINEKIAIQGKIDALKRQLMQETKSEKRIGLFEELKNHYLSLGDNFNAVTAQESMIAEYKRSGVQQSDEYFIWVAKEDVVLIGLLEKAYLASNDNIYDAKKQVLLAELYQTLFEYTNPLIKQEACTIYSTQSKVECTLFISPGDNFQESCCQEYRTDSHRTDSTIETELTPEQIAFESFNTHLAASSTFDQKSAVYKSYMDSLVVSNEYNKASDIAAERSRFITQTTLVSGNEKIYAQALNFLDWATIYKAAKNQPQFENMIMQAELKMKQQIRGDRNLVADKTYCDSYAQLDARTKDYRGDYEPDFCSP